MIKHLVKLFWIRRRTNFPILLEIFISFLVLFVVCFISLDQWQSFHHPLGFGIQNIYAVNLDLTSENNVDHKEDNDITRCLTLLEELKARPEVISAASVSPAPYSSSIYMSTFKCKGKEVRTFICEVSDDAFTTMDTKILYGRGFEDADDAADVKPIVISKKLAEDLFSGEDPLNKTDDEGKRKIVGVVEDFRYSGEFTEHLPFFFVRQSLKVIPEQAYMPISSICVRVRPGTPAAFEEQMAKLIEQILPGSNARIDDIGRMRSLYLREGLSKTLIAWLMAGFLLIMVILGMVGVFWLSVTRRTEEIGLRRAVGSTRKKIHQQLIMEILILSSIGMALASLLILQVPFLGLMDSVNWSPVFLTLSFSTIFMYLLASISGLYPAWLASKIQPANALHYE
jgi:putative ABC transport system permease protein